MGAFEHPLSSDRETGDRVVTSCVANRETSPSVLARFGHCLSITTSIRPTKRLMSNTAHQPPAPALAPCLFHTHDRHKLRDSQYYLYVVQQTSLFSPNTPCSAIPNHA
ncbi:hypothetical protein VTJ04DRAFT_6024 [Mycothermus thermophilus]|uniref:uncharacterized protein n=1 Tax=Humicola insolens TaxID=85995 RepID=UPI003744924C